MKLISKRLKREKNKVQDTSYEIKEAIALVKSTTSAKFNESIEAHISLFIDPKYADQQLRTTVALPHGTGKELRIAVLVPTENTDLISNSSADITGSDDLFDDISHGILDFDLLITTPIMMPKLAKLGRVLGPKGLMPSPKAGTVTVDLESAVKEFKKGKLEYRADKAGVVHISFGKADFSSDSLLENLTTFYNSVESNKPSGVKGKYVKKLTICSTMGPGINVDFNTF